MTIVEFMTMIEFTRTRLAEAAAAAVPDSDALAMIVGMQRYVEAVAAVEPRPECLLPNTGGVFNMRYMVHEAAVRFADHPDYDPSWRPANDAWDRLRWGHAPTEGGTT
jgi:hypothetical protein